jgi:hypothetical protein
MMAGACNPRSLLATPTQEAMQQIWEKTIVPVTSTKFRIAYELSMVDANAVMREFTGHFLLPIRRLSPTKKRTEGTIHVYQENR